MMNKKIYISKKTIILIATLIIIALTTSTVKLFEIKNNYVRQINFLNSERNLYYTASFGSTDDGVKFTNLINFDYKVINRDALIMGAGGALAALNNIVFIAREQNGTLYEYDTASKRITKSIISLPSNNFNLLPDKTPSGNGWAKSYFRYNDIEFIQKNKEFFLVASYTYFNPEKVCFTSRLSVINLTGLWPTKNMAISKNDAHNWDLIWESAPCIPFLKNNGEAFYGNLAGGRIAPDKHGYLYLTVGNYNVDYTTNDQNKLEDSLVSGDLFKSKQTHSLFKNSSYGRVLKFKIADWSFVTYTTGHRNPQGIAVDDTNHVWETEHGPMGGDELNLLIQGKDYGWPIATLGVSYYGGLRDNKKWPPNSSQGRHDNYVSPVFAWLPSIGISNIKIIKGLDPLIDGDLLISSIQGDSLFRVRLDGNKVQYVEPIKIGQDIRYIEIANNEIYLLLDDGAFATLTPRKISDIAQEGTDDTIMGKCYQCHGPFRSAPLEGIIGKKIASQLKAKYSQSLIESGGTWSEPRLRSFLKDPDKFAPGTYMPNLGLTDEEINRIISQLKRLSN